MVKPFKHHFGNSQDISFWLQMIASSILVFHFGILKPLLRILEMLAHCKPTHLSAILRVCSSPRIKIMQTFCCLWTANWMNIKYSWDMSSWLHELCCNFYRNLWQEIWDSYSETKLWYTALLCSTIIGLFSGICDLLDFIEGNVDASGYSEQHNIFQIYNIVLQDWQYSVEYSSCSGWMWGIFRIILLVL